MSEPTAYYRSKLEEKVSLGIYHDYDHESNRRKLQHLYGKLARRQNDLILGIITGRRVLDVGAGYGILTKLLIESGFDTVAIDSDLRITQIAKSWFKVNVIPADIHLSPFKDKSFDTVILREIVEHLDFEKAVLELNRIVSKEVIIFQSNLTWLLRGLRLLIRHKEFKPRPLDYYISVLQRAGYQVQGIKFCDIIALPISGGLLIKQLCPSLDWIENMILKIDHRLCEIIRRIGISKLLCWRYLLRAVRTD